MDGVKVAGSPDVSIFMFAKLHISSQAFLELPG